jgi:hypothetical protein
MTDQFSIGSPDLSSALIEERVMNLSHLIAGIK